MIVEKSTVWNKRVVGKGRERGKEGYSSPVWIWLSCKGEGRRRGEQRRREG